MTNAKVYTRIPPELVSTCDPGKQSVSGSPGFPPQLRLLQMKALCRALHRLYQPHMCALSLSIHCGPAALTQLDGMWHLHSSRRFCSGRDGWWKQSWEFSLPAPWVISLYCIVAWLHSFRMKNKKPASSCYFAVLLDFSFLPLCGRRILPSNMKWEGRKSSRLLISDKPPHVTLIPLTL